MKRFFTICSVALLGFALSIVALSNWSSFGWQALSVPTGSMNPSIPPGSLVLVHRVSAQNIKVGDVITYNNPQHAGQTITHRVVKTYMISGKVPGYVTKGDANKTADIPVPIGSVQGKVLFHVPHVGAWMMWSKTPWGMLPFIWLPALLIMIEEVQRLNAYYKLSRPYRMIGFRGGEEPIKVPRKLLAAGSMTAVFLLVGMFLWQPAFALLRSNTVSLAHNRLSVAATTHPPTNCTNNTNININNSSTQTSTTGNANNSNNTTGGAATSGNASNNNSTNVNIHVNGC